MYDVNIFFNSLSSGPRVERMLLQLSRAALCDESMQVLLCDQTALDPLLLVSVVILFSLTHSTCYGVRIQIFPLHRIRLRGDLFEEITSFRNHARHYSHTHTHTHTQSNSRAWKTRSSNSAFTRVLQQPLS